MNASRTKIAIWGSVAAVGSLLLMLLVVSLVRWSLFGWEYYPYGWLDVGNGRAIAIAGEIFHDEGQGFQYTVRERGEAVVPPTFLGPAGYGGASFLDCGFSAYYAADGNLVAITENSTPHYVLVVHDFRSGFSYPAHCNEHSKSPKFAAVLAELQEANPHIRFSKWDPDSARIRSGGHWW